MSDREYRYERKFLVDQLDAQQVRALIKRHPAMFYEPYPPRYINNFYLDTQDMANYQDNVSGADRRCKVRIRWYGELFRPVTDGYIEYKIKNGLVGTKDRYQSPAFAALPGFNYREFQAVIKDAELPPQVKREILALDVVLMNRYYRWYFATRDGKFRVTIDTGLTYFKVSRLQNHFLRKSVDHENIVIELKYSLDGDADAHRISSFFPFSLTKNSKYVQGIERVY
jgi:SPX domain protein involved in polyphosphate accumulation